MLSFNYTIRFRGFAMDSEVIGLAGSDEDILTFDVTDDALETRWGR